MCTALGSNKEAAVASGPVGNVAGHLDDVININFGTRRPGKPRAAAVIFLSIGHAFIDDSALHLTEIRCEKPSILCF